MRLKRLTTLIGGDGPKMIDLLQMREKYLLQDRIEILGPVRHSDVHKVSKPPVHSSGILLLVHRSFARAPYL